VSRFVTPDHFTPQPIKAMLDKLTGIDNYAKKRGPEQAGEAEDCGLRIADCGLWIEDCGLKKLKNAN